MKLVFEGLDWPLGVVRVFPVDSNLPKNKSLIKVLLSQLFLLNLTRLSWKISATTKMHDVPPKKIWSNFRNFAEDIKILAEPGKFVRECACSKNLPESRRLIRFLKISGHPRIFSSDLEKWHRSVLQKFFLDSEKCNRKRKKSRQRLKNRQN